MIRALRDRRRSIKVPPAVPVWPLPAMTTLELRHTRSRPPPAGLTPYKTPHDLTNPGACSRLQAGAGSQIVGALTVRGDVEPFALLLFRHPQANYQLHDAEGDEGDRRRPDHHEQHGRKLCEELRPYAGISRGARDPVDRRARPAERGRIEDAGHERTEGTAERVHPEDIERIVRADEALETGHAPQAHHADPDSDHEGSRNAHIAGG